MEIQLMEPGLVKLDVSGRASGSDIDTLMDESKSIFSEYKDVYLLIDVKGFYSFPITKRTSIYEFIDGLFKDGQVAFIMIIYPNHFVRMVGFLTRSIYKNIRYAYFNTEEEALSHFYSSYKVGDADITLVQLTEALDKKLPNDEIQLVSVENWQSSLSSGRLTQYFFAPNILFQKMEGAMTVDVVEEMHDTIKRFSSPGKKIDLVIDLSGCKSISKGARTSFEENEKEKESYVESKFFRFPSFVSALYKIYTYINPSYAKNTTLIRSTEKTILNLLKERKEESQVSYQLPEFGEPAKDQFESFDKEELISYLESYHEENRDKWNNVTGNIDQLFEVVSKIAWKEDFTIKELNVPEGNDPFHDLFYAVNILQHDIGEIVTQLKEANESLEQKVEERTHLMGEKESNLRSLIENYNSPICLLDTEFNLVDCNIVFQKLIQRVFDIHVEPTHNLFETANNELREHWMPRFALSAKGDFVNVTEEFEAEGQLFYYDIRIFPIKNNDVVIGVGMAGNNVTELKRSTKKLEEQNVSLKKLNNELDSFIYRSSHDLRAPVSSLLGLINIAKMESSVEEKDKCLNLMEVSVNKMEAFIREIIDHTKNTKLDLEPSEINFEDMVSGLVDELRHLDHNNHIRFNIDIKDTSFITDRFRIETILTNVISNCIKYYDDSKESFVSILMERDGDSAHFLVKDNGQGIRPEHMENLYDMFYRANDSSNGTGLGLYIVKDVLEKLNGEIKINSTYGEGTEVEIRIPELTMDKEESV